MASPSNVYFQNASEFPVVVHYKLGQRNLDQHDADEPVIVPAGETRELPDLSTALEVQIVVQPYPTTVDVLGRQWDGVTGIVDGVPFTLPNPTTEDIADEEDHLKGPFRYRMSYTFGTRTIKFQGTIACGEWTQDQCQASILGIEDVAACTRFASARSSVACSTWCDSHPDECAQVKVQACSEAGGGDYYRDSPECLCIAKDASRVRLPDTLNMTYGEFRKTMLAAGATHLGDDVCWYPGCDQSRGALLTPHMVDNSKDPDVCPVDQPVQICVAYAESVSINGGSDNSVNFLNCCRQVINPDATADGPGAATSPGCGPGASPGHSKSGPGPGPGPGPGVGPGSGPGVSPEEFLKSPAGIGVLVGVGVVVLILIVVGVVIGSKKRGPPQSEKTPS
jgi:hypothetical protein